MKPARCAESQAFWVRMQPRALATPALRTRLIGGGSGIYVPVFREAARLSLPWLPGIGAATFRGSARPVAVGRGAREAGWGRPLRSGEGVPPHGARSFFNRSEAEAIGLPGADSPRTMNLYRTCLASDRGPGCRRLEFIGDAVLYLACTDRLFRWGSSIDGGEPLSPREMHDLRVGQVRNVRLAAVGRALGLDEKITDCGVWQAFPGSPGRRLPPGDKRVADSVEALIGAVYVSFGFEASRDFVERVVLPDGFPGICLDIHPERGSSPPPGKRAPSS